MRKSGKVLYCDEEDGDDGDDGDFKKIGSFFFPASHIIDSIISISYFPSYLIEPYKVSEPQNSSIQEFHGGSKSKSMELGVP